MESVKSLTETLKKLEEKQKHYKKNQHYRGYYK